MNTTDMRKTRLPPGHMFRNVAPLGSKPNWKIVKVPSRREQDANA